MFENNIKENNSDVTRAVYQHIVSKYHTQSLHLQFKDNRPR